MKKRKKTHGTPPSPHHYERVQTFWTFLVAAGLVMAAAIQFSQGKIRLVNSSHDMSIRTPAQLLVAPAPSPSQNALELKK